jgi:hypothetical protein
LPLKSVKTKLIVISLGYVPGDGDRGISEDQYIEKLVSTGLVKKEEIVLDCHCMHPAFLEQQLQVSFGGGRGK